MIHDARHVVPLTADPRTPLDYALLYAARGWPVLPTHTMLEHGGCSCGQVHCKTPGKHPRTPHGVADATTDAAQIRAWWRAWPDTNVAIACGQVSGLLIIDVDPRNGGDLTLEELEAQYGPIPRDAVVETGGGGLHIYLRHPGHAVAGKLGPGIDVKSDGGYVIAPPSTHVLGPHYGWYDDIDETFGARVGDTPTWVSRRLTRQTRPDGPTARGFTPPVIELGAHEAEQIVAALAHIDPDARDNWLTVGMALHAAGAGTQGWLLWQEWSARSAKYNLRDQARVWHSFSHDKTDEITLGSVYHLARQAGWVYTPAAEPAPEPEPAVDRVERTPRTPPELLTVPGELGAMVDWINATAAQPQPLFAVQAALALGAVTASRIYRTQWNNYSSLYLLCVSGSGTGKEHGKRAIESVLEAAGHGDLVGPDGYASGAAVFSALYGKPAHIAGIDEMGKLLASTHNQQHRVDALTELMQVFGRLHGVMRPKGYSTTGLNAEQSRELQERLVRRPALSIYGLTTPDTFLAALTEAAVGDGLLPRFTIVVSHEPRVATLPKIVDAPPSALADWVQAVRQPADQGPLASAYQGDPAVAPTAVDMKIADAAQDRLLRFKQAILELQNDLDAEHGLAELPNRWAENATRIALIVALSRDPARRVIGEQDMAWAITYVEHHGHVFLRLARDKLGLNAFAALVADLAALIARHAQGLSRRELGQYSRRFRNLKPREQDEVLQAMVNSGEVVSGQRKNARGPGVQAFVAATRRQPVDNPSTVGVDGYKPYIPMD